MSRRADADELMDATDVPFADYSACLRDLERVNVVTLAYRPTLAWLDGLWKAGCLPRGRAVSIVDIGCGRGDMLRRIGRWARRRGVEARLVGIDRDPRAVRAAVRAAPESPDIGFVCADILEWSPEGPIDLVVSSLFGHHLDDRSLTRFIAWMEETSRLGWFVNDLHRHPLPWLAFRAWSRLAGWHRFVQHDGPVSISRAFVADDWRKRLAKAGVPAGAATVRRHMPYRLCVARAKAP